MSDFVLIERKGRVAIATLRTPVIIAVSGFALGGGCEFTMKVNFKGM